MTASSRDRLRFGCPRCLTRLEAKPTQAGKSRRCPVCYFKLTVPTAEEVAATAARWREPGYQLQSGQNETIPHAAAYQTYFAVVCSVCGTRMYATPSQVGQEMRCPDCDTAVRVIAPAATPPPPPKETKSTEEYPLYQGEGQPPQDHHEVYQRYIPVVCAICHTRMLATLEQVGERLICPDCETPAIVPPPEDVVSHEPLPVTPSRDPSDVYDIAQPATPPPLPARSAQRNYIAAICPVCHTRLDMTEDKVGTIIECPDCGTRFAVQRPKAALPQPDPMAEIGEEYGVAPPMEVAKRKPAMSESEDLVIDSDDHRTAQERRGLEEEWKNFNQQLRGGGGGGGWQASPAPVAASAEPEKEPTESFFSGVFTFPFYRSSVAYWVALSLGLMFVVLPPMFAYMMAIKQAGGPEWTWVTVASALACIAGLIWILMTSSSCLAILQDTAEGCDDVENWPEGQIFEWLFDAAYILTALLLATAAGLTVARVLLWIGHPWWPSAIIVGWLMFPFILVSMLEAGSPLLPFSGPIVRSLLLAWWAWFLFYLETIVLVAVVGGLGAAVTIYTHYWGSPVAIVMAVAVLMIYFRLVGRLIWFCSHEGALDDEDKAQRTDDKLLHKRTADVG